MFPPVVGTDRLRLDRLTTDDTLALYEHARAGAPNVEEITRYVTWSPHETLGETRAFVASAEANWADGEGATYVVRPREGEPLAGEFGGATGLSIDWPRRTGTLGLWLRKPLWGRGYSGARAAALLELAFDRLDLEVVAVTHSPENDASRRAIERYVERFGGRREGTIRNGEATRDGGAFDVARYSISRGEWRAADAEERVAFREAPDDGRAE
jgi:RimJ/RimL family protein N-acetyltransferase